MLEIRSRARPSFPIQAGQGLVGLGEGKLARRPRRCLSAPNQHPSPQPSLEHQIAEEGESTHEDWRAAQTRHEVAVARSRLSRAVAGVLGCLAPLLANS